MDQNIGEFTHHGKCFCLLTANITIFIVFIKYNFRSKFETLPRTSSKNFKQVELGKPIFDAILSPGDLLYMPRGYIHQADTLFTETHSLHLTISSYQQNSMFDFLKVVRTNTIFL